MAVQPATGLTRLCVSLPIILPAILPLTMVMTIMLPFRLSMMMLITPMMMFFLLVYLYLIAFLYNLMALLPPVLLASPAQRDRTSLAVALAKADRLHAPGLPARYSLPATRY